MWKCTDKNKHGTYQQGKSKQAVDFLERFLFFMAYGVNQLHTFKCSEIPL